MKDWLKIATVYAEEAWADKKQKTHGKWERLACKRFLDDLKRAKRKDCSFYYSPEWAKKACSFIELLPHVEGDWKNPLIVLESWQVFQLVNIFGWRKKKDNTRRYDTVYIEVARKNAKSTLSSGIALFCFLYENETGPQVKCAATTGDQARIVFDVARKMVDKRPQLKSALMIETYKDSIICLRNGGSIKPINSKASTQDGLNPHCSILDELHAHSSRALFDVLRSARGARKNPLSLYITTAGYDTNGVCYEQHSYVKKILESVIQDDSYFGMIYSVDIGDNPLDPTVWRKANPNYGVSVNPDELANYAAQAKILPRVLAEFLIKRCNYWTSAKNSYINMLAWQKCVGKVELETLKDVPCYGGLDLARVSDLAAWALTWKVGEQVKTYVRCYIPEARLIEMNEKKTLPYQQWVDEGWLVVTPGDVTDYAWIEKDIRDALDTYNIQAIAYDPWNATDLVNRLVEYGAPMMIFRQGFQSYNPPMKEIERLVLSKLIEHGGNPVLAWCVSNMIARLDPNQNLAPDKAKSADKIDAIVALLMALGAMLSGAEAEGPSVYESRGFIEVDF